MIETKQLFEKSLLLSLFIQSQFNGINQGRCGECGDEWSLPRPRPNDEGGLYGKGIVGQVYFQGQVIRIEVQLTASHMGFFEFRLCPKKSAQELATQECFDAHLLHMLDGSTRYQVNNDAPQGLHWPLLKLPKDVICKYCVIQWTYTAGRLSLGSYVITCKHFDLHTNVFVPKEILGATVAMERVDQAVDSKRPSETVPMSPFFLNIQSPNLITLSAKLC